ncbi:hypothetical protein B7H23_03500 [Notoacmeibacter marinus]|uniref:Blue (type 1) copper domain-containing protein n=1 Tax=Notoacmeibacter marinus TaxID=1876515 RepID=A0A231V1D1_9HYPH|nr:plastocyanin/azurin family copper-binding protein [Notoacmeibacter marinus]OXT02009.1 hypothetical protein B7H23_03500 [Notoacmeibacter marinus]
MTRALKTLRRGRLQIWLAALVFLAAPGAQTAKADSISVDQITDLSAKGARTMFRFAPELVRIDAGGTIEIRNSVRGHTVHSIPELWPADAPPVAISYRPSAVVRFTESGLYGLTCKRHGVYGMVMLVLVGDAESPDDLNDRIEAAKLSDDARQKLKSIAAGGGLLD